MPGKCAAPPAPASGPVGLAAHDDADVNFTHCQTPARQGTRERKRHYSQPRSLRNDIWRQQVLDGLNAVFQRKLLLFQALDGQLI